VYVRLCAYISLESVFDEAENWGFKIQYALSSQTDANYNGAENRNRNRNKFINQIMAPGGHIQITIMIDTQQQYIKLNIRGEISIIVVQAQLSSHHQYHSLSSVVVPDTLHSISVNAHFTRFL
jgi:hypothetical protein